MDREIKFRAWVFGGLDEGEKPFMEEVSAIDFEFGKVNRVYWTQHDEFSYANECYLMQYTGLKDRGGKGVDVYEGDIIGRTSFVDKFIIWDGCGFYTCHHNNIGRIYPLTYLDEFDVVIGNIYENPELVIKNSLKIL
jgi:hypothetical protein